MVNYLASALGGLVIGILINLLANWLPAYRATKAEQPDEAAADEPAVEPEPTRPPMLRYVLVELAMAGLAAALVGRTGFTPMFGVLLFYTAVFMLIAVIDIEHRLVLNVVMFPAFVIALIEVFASGRIEPLRGLAGYAIAQIVVMGFYLLGGLYLWIINRGRDTAVNEVAFGFGDVTLATFCGLIVGTPGVIIMLVLTVFLGGLFAVLFIAYRALFARGYKAHTALPYGPSIVIAAILMLVWGEPIIARLAGG
jgi:leader peptidase (prepilin peptidase)/N-methyltransferase